MQSLCVYLAIILIPLDNYLISAKKDYKGSSVLRVDLRNEKQAKAFKELSRTFGYEVDEWGANDIFVPNEEISRVVKSRLEQHGFSYRTLIDDVGRLINDVEAKNQKYEEHERRKRAVSGSVGSKTRGPSSSLLPSYVVGRYATFKEIKEWLHEVKDIAKPMIEMFTLGQTYRNNDIYLIKIGKPSNFTKPAIWMDFGVHGREWISPATATYIIYHLLEEYFNNLTETIFLLDNVDLYLLPMANPDGYIYTHEEDRMWRKNRTPDYGTSGCNGTDLNRNFPFHWGEARASCYQCDTQYRGPFAQSEIETQAITSAVQTLRKSLRVYITVHSYSQMWLTRWGYSRDEAEDVDEQVSLARKAVQAIYMTSGLNYTVGSSSNVMSKTTHEIRPKFLGEGHRIDRFSGGAADWAKGSAGIKYAFGVELRDRGEYGFVLPVEQINETGAEFLAALKVVGQQIIAECKTDPYFNKRKRDDDNVKLENILRKELSNTDAHFHLSDNNRKITGSDPTSSPTKQRTNTHSHAPSTLREKSHWSFSLLVIFSMAFVTVSSKDYV